MAARTRRHKSYDKQTNWIKLRKNTRMAIYLFLFVFCIIISRIGDRSFNHRTKVICITIIIFAMSIVVVLEILELAPIIERVLKTSRN